MRWIGAWLLAAGLFAGCPYSADRYAYRAPRAHADTGRDAVRSRARVSLQCDEVSVRVLAASGFLASGCGQEQSYTCAGTGRDLVCVPEAPPRASRERAEAWGADAEAIEAIAPDDAVLARAALADCPRSDADGTILLTITSTGHVQRVETPGLSVAAAACAVQALRAASFALRAATERRQVEVRAGEVVVPVDAATVGVDAARAFVDDQRSRLLACTGGATTPIWVAWTADGALTVRLPDARAGTREDTCVRAALPGARLIPAPGAAGSVVHVVQ